MIIQSLLDTDLYKLTMMQAVLHQFPGAIVEYAFKCRTANVDLSPLADRITQEIENLCELQFTQDELQYLSQFSFFKSDFIDFLRIFNLNREFIHITTDDEFTLTIKGPWLHTILFEVPILAIISELYFQQHYPNFDLKEGRCRLQQKIGLIKDNPNYQQLRFSDFGTRRRFSHRWQSEVDHTLAEMLPKQFSGTSNILFAKQHNICPIGTMAHEYLQACQALGPRLSDSQRFAFEHWAQEYRGELGIALSDVCGMDAFFHDFDLFFCKLFDGARNDSGDPFVWGEKLLAHYQKMRIDAKTKTMVFSNNLTFPKALKLFNHFKQHTKPVFGIGTNLTNDVGPEPIQIVIKMIECNGQPVAKVSDDPGKTMCRDISYLNYLKQVFHITP